VGDGQVIAPYPEALQLGFTNLMFNESSKAFHYNDEQEGRYRVRLLKALGRVVGVTFSGITGEDFMAKIQFIHIWAKP